MLNLKIYCLIKNKSSICNQKSFNYAANVVDESPKKNPERFEMGYRATIIFFEKLGQIRSSDFMKRNTILIIDADRGYISGLYPKKGSFFEKQRNFFIQHAKNKGFTVIDLEDVFTEKFKEGLTLNSSVDGHWNENGHKIVFDTLLKEIKDIISK